MWEDIKVQHSEDKVTWVCSVWRVKGGIKALIWIPKDKINMEQLCGKK